MKLKVLAYQTLFAVLSPLGEVRHTPHHACVISPRNPKWYWGTFMVHAHAPTPNCRSAWEAAYDATVSDTPGIGHRSFAWNEPRGRLAHTAQFTEAGYTCYHSVTLLIEGIKPARTPLSDLTIRPIRSDEDWARVLELQLILAREKYDAGKGNFKQQQMRDFRELTKRGLGEWWGAWYQGRLVSDMGIFASGSGLASLQQVETHPDFRRRGFSDRLLRQALIYAFSKLNAHTVVVQAEAGSAGEALYRSAGGYVAERTVELTKVKNIQDQH